MLSIQYRILFLQKSHKRSKVIAYFKVASAEAKFLSVSRSDVALDR